jgi:anti-sigma regulatory factor (Ser/Thr protein kinase)
VEVRDSAENRLQEVFEVTSHDFSSAGSASSKIKRMLQQIGVAPAAVRRIAVSSYEAEMNVVIHSDGGRMILDVGPDQVEITVEDHGPGIADIERAMQPGFSTATDDIREMGFGAGMGLPNMRACADELEVTSTPGAGTKVKMTFFNR